jgi:hypothetical protein
MSVALSTPKRVERLKGFERIQEIQPLKRGWGRVLKRESTKARKGERAKARGASVFNSNDGVLQARVETFALKLMRQFEIFSQFL